MKERFENNLKTRFAKLEGEMTASNFSKIMKEATKLDGKTKGKKTTLLSTEGREIKQLEDSRKELRKRENRSARENVEYTELSNTVKKKR